MNDCYSDKEDNEEQNQIAQEEIFLVEMLATEGVNNNEIQKLKKNGILSLKSLVMNTKRDLVNIYGIPDNKADSYVKKASEILARSENSRLFSSEFVLGTTVLQRRSQIRRISTGSKALDDILNGGIESQSITEFYGEYRSGKTQIAHTACVLAQSQDHCQSPGKVLYIDTEGTFRPERICQIASHYGMEGEYALSNIIYGRAYNVDQQNTLLIKGAQLMVEENCFALLVVDSIMANFRCDFSGRGDLSERQQALGKFMSRLQRMAAEFNIAVIITNQVMADPSGAMTGGAIPQPKPIGGHILAHASTQRLFMKKKTDNIRKVKLVDSPYLQDKEVDIMVSDRGVGDVECDKKPSTG
ncbi:meiotic recombination protein DMC1, putative (macronuclear) [Tetrahymena thermophila SB210]|uniref:Meiotic recombination protein DMC1, putative n=1 Tax=Tetrahymena thermophila (strain SB210) TaxID=312017 RepID=I7MAA0_TETTS|nr:meiotic recombination protein DMC1, putative [Tetrahymena thermophila SB210]EAS03986.1 meiotic recombination protein DMC1, putative [Tetrahymena thermophila SB210]|eukprot:XP_001024231.1 meiotic recombination protein DMC1, putative [Tetrahymena thermophila SB210]